MSSDVFRQLPALHAPTVPGSLRQSRDRPFLNGLYHFLPYPLLSRSVSFETLRMLCWNGQFRFSPTTSSLHIFMTLLCWCFFTWLDFFASHFSFLPHVLLSVPSPLPNLFILFPLSTLAWPCDFQRNEGIKHQTGASRIFIVPFETCQNHQIRHRKVKVQSQWSYSCCQTSTACPFIVPSTPDCSRRRSCCFYTLACELTLT